MTVEQIVEELRALGSESIKRVLIKHGAQEPFFGVKIEHLKNIQKRVKKNHALALGLYDTGISDAMYLAALIADDSQMTPEDLQLWAEQAYWSYLSEHAVAWVAAGSEHGWEMALKWIDSERENVASSGWATLSGLVAITEDAALDMALLQSLLERVEYAIHEQPNRVRSVMNGFVISAGVYVLPLADFAIGAGERIGKVFVDAGDTACKVPFAPDYIRKCLERGAGGKKKKTLQC